MLPYLSTSLDSPSFFSLCTMKEGTEGPWLEVRGVADRDADPDIDKDGRGVRARQ